jgi:putative MATE family efflux protein
MSERTIAKGGRGRIDFTSGEPWKKIIVFALPLRFSNLLQQLYNTVGSIIVGRGVSHVGLAAVGLAGPYLRVLTSLFMGVAMGGNVLVAQQYGAKDKAGLRRTVHSAIVLSITVGLTLSVIGIVLAPFILKWTSVPDEVYPMALTYMRILFAGIVFQMTYNMLASFLRGMGNSHTQLIILIISSIANIVLTWVFVIYFKWGVAGSGYALFISQLLSVVIIFFYLQRNEWTRISLKELKLHAAETKELLRIGLPTAVQQVVMSLAGMIVMGYITTYGTETIAGYSAGNTIDMYIQMPIQSLNMSVTPFAAQNVGAGKMDRVRTAAKQVVLINTGINLVISAAVLIFSRSLLGLFTVNAATIAAGTVMLRCIVPTNILSAINQPLSGVIRGSGDPVTPMINSLMMVVVIRIPVIILLNRTFGRIEVVYFSQAISYFYGIIHILIVYNKGKWKKRALARIEALKRAASKSAETEAEKVI